MKQKCVLGVDIGSSNVKAILFSLLGNVISQGSREIGDITPGEKMLEQSPELIWNQFCEAVKQCTESVVIDNYDVIGMAMDSNRCGFLLLDSNHNPLTNIYTWRDKRAIAQTEKYHGLNTDYDHYLITGEKGAAAHTIMKIMWAKENIPQILNECRHLYFSPLDYVLYRLIGIDAASRSIAQSTGLLDINSLDYSRCILEKVGVDQSILPTLYDSTDVVGELTGEMADKLGVPQKTRVFAGLCDASASQIGSGAVEEGSFAISIGTCAAIRTFSNQPKYSTDKSISVRLVSPFGYVPSCTLTDAGGVLKWFREQFCKYELMLQNNGGVDCYKQMDIEAERLPIGCEGLLAITSLSGQSFNGSDTVYGALVNLGNHHTHAHVARALMEGVGMHLRMILEQFEKSGYRVSDAVLVGGGSKSKFWRQMICDIFNLTIKVPECEEAGCVGSAIIAAVGAGIFDNLSDAVKAMVKIKEVCVPDQKAVLLYDAVYEKMKVLHKCLGNFYSDK